LCRLQFNIKCVAIKLKAINIERPTSNFEYGILLILINRRSKAISSFDVQRSMLDVQETLYSAVQYFLNLATMPLLEKFKNIIHSLLKLLNIFFLAGKVKPFSFARA